MLNLLSLEKQFHRAWSQLEWRQFDPDSRQTCSFQSSFTLISDKWFHESFFRTSIIVTERMMKPWLHPDMIFHTYHRIMGTNTFFEKAYSLPLQVLFTENLSFVSVTCTYIYHGRTEISFFFQVLRREGWTCLFSQLIKCVKFFRNLSIFRGCISSLQFEQHTQNLKIQCWLMISVDSFRSLDYWSRIYSH